MEQSAFVPLMAFAAEMEGAGVPKEPLCRHESMN